MTNVIDADLRREIDQRSFWYHTLELGSGVVTPGLFDLRSIVDRLPWPDVKGKRCLDVGTFDGFFAFELERRGAAEVVAVDVHDWHLYDWPANVRPGLVANDVGERLYFDEVQGQGFALAARALQSTADWRPISIYDLDPDLVGTFEVVVCSSLLLHLRDPIRALEAVRSVCTGQFMSFEPIDLWLTAWHRRAPVAHFNGIGDQCQWWTPNGSAQLAMLTSAGFRVDQVGKPIVVPFDRHQRPKTTARGLATRLLTRVATGTWTQGVVQRATLSTPSL